MDCHIGSAYATPIRKDVWFQLSLRGYEAVHVILLVLPYKILLLS